MKLLVASLALFMTFTARAHDFWIEPSTFAPRAGDLVTLRLKVGHFEAGEPVARNSARIEQFVTISAAHRTPVTGVDGRDPAGYVRWSEDPVGIVAYEGKPNTTTISPKLFAQYVREERLAKPDRTPKGNVRDHFSRSARLLFDDGTGAWQKPAGLTLEIFPESDPWRDRTLRVRLMFKGEPLRNAAVTAIDRANPKAEVRTRTDREGRASLTIDSPGPWLVKSVHAVRIGPDEYRSWWGSLVFARPATSASRSQR